MYGYIALDMLMITILILVVLGLCLIIWRNSQLIKELENRVETQQHEIDLHNDNFNKYAHMFLKQRGFVLQTDIPYWDGCKKRKDGTDIIVYCSGTHIGVGTNKGTSTKIYYGNMCELVETIEKIDPL